MSEREFLFRQWQYLLAGYTLSSDLKKAGESHFFDLWQAHNMPTRFYHNATHLVHLFSLLGEFEACFTLPRIMAWAVFFHDSVYDTRQSDNEQKSADYARRVMQELGCLQAEADRVYELILATQNHCTACTLPEFHYFLDADLSILGSLPDVYNQYSRAIRQEYAWVPDELYCVGRQKVLQNLLDKSSLYFTKPMQQRYEHQARQNIASEIDFLDKK